MSSKPIVFRAFEGPKGDGVLSRVGRLCLSFLMRRGSRRAVVGEEGGEDEEAVELLEEESLMIARTAGCFGKVER